MSKINCHGRHYINRYDPIPKEYEKNFDNKLTRLDRAYRNDFKSRVEFYLRGKLAQFIDYERIYNTPINIDPWSLEPMNY